MKDVKLFVRICNVNQVELTAIDGKKIQNEMKFKIEFFLQILQQNKTNFKKKN